RGPHRPDLPEAGPSRVSGAAPSGARGPRLPPGLIVRSTGGPCAGSARRERKGRLRLVSAQVVPTTDPYRPFAKAMRSGVVGPATRALLGALLFLLSTKTAKYFAWTIQPSLTAAVLGANYWASTVLALLASRMPYWAQGRIS